MNPIYIELYVQHRLREADRARRASPASVGPRGRLVVKAAALAGRLLTATGQCIEAWSRTEGAVSEVQKAGQGVR
jgi:hypothetical protein